MDKTVRVIVGPTASGKSAFAIKMAQELDGVIINCDAMQSYDALHILTAQPSRQEVIDIPHRLYGHLHPSIHYSAADWRKDAIVEIESAWASCKTPIICGGTGFYLKALIEGLSPIPEIPMNVREEGIALQKKIGNPAFYYFLRSRDPKIEGHIDPMNTQRNIRAWEVLEYTGQSIIEWQSAPLIGRPQGWNFHVTALFPDRETLINKINSRLYHMMDLGIMDEVITLVARIESGEVPETSLIVKAHGFRPFRRYLNGEWSLEQAIDYTQTETRQYSKRQMTWFRNQIKIDEVIS